MAPNGLSGFRRHRQNSNASASARMSPTKTVNECAQCNQTCRPKTIGKVSSANSALSAFTNPAPSTSAAMPAPTTVCAFCAAGISNRALGGGNDGTGKRMGGVLFDGSGDAVQIVFVKAAVGNTINGGNLQYTFSQRARFVQHDGIDLGSFLHCRCVFKPNAVFHCFAIPIRIAAGVDGPSAHGQAITKTATACISATVQSPIISQVTIKVNNAMPATAGTNTAAALSATSAIGALLPCASESAFIMSPSGVWLPSCAARYTTLRFGHQARPPTLCRPPFSLRDWIQPVRWLSSAQPLPLSITPSAAVRSPWLARIRSPICTWSMGSCFHSPSRCTLTWVGVSFEQQAQAVQAGFLVRCSKNLPSNTKPINITPASKYTCAIPCAACGLKNNI